jgi:hypothetical protein
MKINFKNVLRINNKIENKNTIYYKGLPNKDFINHSKLPLMLEAIFSNLIIIRSLSFYLNSFNLKHQLNNNSNEIKIKIKKRNKGQKVYFKPRVIYKGPNINEYKDFKSVYKKVKGCIYKISKAKLN